MSDNIPIEIQELIIKRLPVNSLLQFRSVSKAWKSLIDSSSFIRDYSDQQQHLLVRYLDSVDFERKYSSVVDDDVTFPSQKVSLFIPHLVKMFKDSITVDTSHGLLCLYGDYPKGLDAPIFGNDRVVLWNPSIRKAVAIVVPNVGKRIYRTSIGFGVCPNTIDPKIVKINYIRLWKDMERIPNSIPWQVEVFTLSTGAWRSPNSTNLPRTSIALNGGQVVIDGFLYWLAIDRITMDGRSTCNLIISFDMTSEEFTEVSLPQSLARQRFEYDLSMSKIRESLVVIDQSVDADDNPVFHVWMMQDGVPKMFTKLFTINSPDATVRGVLNFRKTGEPIIEIFEHGRGPLVVYEPYSKHINNLGISGLPRSFYVYPYIKTLLLLDQPTYFM